MHSPERLTFLQGWEQRKDENNVTGTGKEWWYHWKADELKRANPSALVPTLIPVDPATGEANESKVCWTDLPFFSRVSNCLMDCCCSRRQQRLVDVCKWRGRLCMSRW